MRMQIRADVNRQPGPYMWVQLAESPLGLGQLYVRKPFQCKGKVDILQWRRWKTQKFNSGKLNEASRLDVSSPRTEQKK
jgi:hypothetical protein